MWRYYMLIRELSRVSMDQLLQRPNWSQAALTIRQYLQPTLTVADVVLQKTTNAHLRIIMLLEQELQVELQTLLAKQGKAKLPLVRAIEALTFKGVFRAAWLDANPDNVNLDLLRQHPSQSRGPSVPWR